MKYILTLLCICISTCAIAVTKAETQSVDKALAKLSKVIGKKITADSITNSPIPGILQVSSDMNVFYVSADGGYVFSGDLIDLAKNQQNWSITEQAVRNLRKQALAAVNPQDMIIFPAKKSKLGYVTVFTDIDCSYCHKLQADMQAYNDLGIEIRYLAFPRAGLKSASFDKAATVWCATNRQSAIDLAMQGKDLPKNICKNNPIAAQFELGMKLGINGTPTIILENGAKLPGFVSADDLAKIMKQEAK